MIVTGQPIQIGYIVDDIANKLPMFDRLRWYRSRTGPNGIYEVATASSVEPARITTTKGPYGALSGTRLKVRVDNDVELDIVFASPDPISATQAASEINSAHPNINANGASGNVVISTVAVGSAASLEILEGTDAFTLGVAAGQAAVGRDMDHTLLSGVHEYIYTDGNSDPEYWYRTQFWHSSDTQYSTLSVPIASNAADHVALSETIAGFLRITDMSGRPIACRKVTIYNTFAPSTVVSEGKSWGAFRHYVEMITNRDGYAEVRLLRGIEVDVAIDGTGYIRRIKIPTTGDKVNLLGPELSVRDEFGIRTPDIDYAIRTS